MAVSQKVRRFMEEGGWIRRVFEEGLALKAQIGADKVFDLSLVDTDGLPLEGPVTLGQPINVKVRIDTREVALAGGDESRIAIQHYHQDEGWEVLETSVDFTSSVASAQVDSLSVFALTIKEPESPPALRLPKLREVSPSRTAEFLVTAKLVSYREVWERSALA